MSKSKDDCKGMTRAGSEVRQGGCCPNLFSVTSL